MKKNNAFDDTGVFIVGCARSGTTLLRMILDSHPEICAGEETGLLNEMQIVLDHRWAHLKHFGLSREEIQKEMRDLFLTFHHRQCQTASKRKWIDKTPSYVKNLRFIRP